jgi:spermidine synthase
MILISRVALLFELFKAKNIGMAPSIFAFGFRATQDAQKRRNRTFLNKASEYFFGELDKGMSSPLMFMATTGVIVAFSWKLAGRYFAPTRELADNRVVGSKVPMSDTHNAFWGLRRSVPAGQHVETMGASVDSDLKRPSLVYSEHSELTTDSDWIVLELSEFDPKLNDDIYFRSLHSLNMKKVDPSTLKRTDAEQRELDHRIELSKATGGAPVSENDMFLNPHIHGMVKCKGVSTDNNCIPYVGALGEEISRKLMLALGPAHLLRDPANTTLPVRFSLVKEAPVKTLICGLKGGELARWLSSAFPNFDVDVVEQDGALVKLARRFLGFREHSSLHLYIADPLDYARKLASREIDKQYDLIVIDCVDGSNQLATQFGRLEFASHVRNGLTKNGMVVANIPNKDPQFIYNVVQNWRMSFHMRAVLLIHCTTSPNTIMMTFQDSADRGKLNFGSVTGVEEFRDIIHTQQSYYGNNRVGFNLAGEINSQNFRVLEPNKEYSMEHYLPIAHPLVMERRAGGSSSSTSRKKTDAGVSSWWSWLSGGDKK